MVFVLCLAFGASAAEPGMVVARFIPSRAVTVWPVDRIGATFATTRLAVERDRSLIAGADRPLLFAPTLPPIAPLVPVQQTVSLHKIGVRELLDGASALDRHSAADRYSAAGAEAGSVFVVELGQGSDIVAYGKQLGVAGGEGTLHLGKLVVASGSAVFSKDGQISILHNLDLKLTKLALIKGPRVSASPFARAGFLLDFRRDGVVRGTIVPGGGLNFTLPSGYPQPLTLIVMASPELTIEPSRGPAQLGVRFMTGAEILMF